MTEFLPDKHELFRAARFGDWGKAREILFKNDKYLYVKDQNGQNFLHIAAVENQIALARNALAAFPAFDIMQEDKNGRTIAHIAAEKGYINFFEKVLLPGYKGEENVIWPTLNQRARSEISNAQHLCLQ